MVKYRTYRNIQKIWKSIEKHNNTQKNIAGVENKKTSKHIENIENNDKCKHMETY